MKLFCVILIIALIISIWKCWVFKCLSIGLMYFASTEHNWNIDEKEAKKILEYSMKRHIKDFFKIKDS